MALLTRVYKYMGYYTNILKMIVMFFIFAGQDCLEIRLSIPLDHVQFSMLWVLREMALNLLSQVLVPKGQAFVVVL